MTDAPDLDAIRAEARAEAREWARRESILDVVEEEAAHVLADPKDARVFLADRVDTFVVGGEIDRSVIREALDELLVAKPYLAGNSVAPRFVGSADGGPRTRSARYGQMSIHDVRELARQGRHAEIEQARVEGRLEELYEDIRAGWY